jgi:hypothetical protein
MFMISLFQVWENNCHFELEKLSLETAQNIWQTRRNGVISVAKIFAPTNQIGKKVASECGKDKDVLSKF